MKKSLILLGAGGHSRSCIEVIERNGQFSIAGLVGLPEEVGNSVLGYPVIGSDADLPEILHKYPRAIISVGQIKNPEPRKRLFQLAKKYNCELPVIISPHALVSKHSTIGDGTIIMHGAIINSEVSIGMNCIINSQSLIEHDVVVKDHCHISTAATVNSGVIIGNDSFIGSNSCIRQGTVIGESCVIGMGQVIVKNCPDYSWLPKQSG